MVAASGQAQRNRAGCMFQFFSIGPVHSVPRHIVLRIIEHP